MFLAMLLASQMSFGECTDMPDVSRYFSAGWGIDLKNQRIQHDTGISAANAGTLVLKWAYGYANDKPRSWPLVSGDTIFIGNSGLGLVALDRSTGCTRWTRPQEGEIGTAILTAEINGEQALIYAIRTEGLYAVSALNGKLIWHTTVEHNPVGMYSSTPLISGDTLFVPMSSIEIGLSLNPLYGCCSTSGGVAAIDITTGKEKWYRSMIEQPGQVTGTRWLFIEKRGPSGAPIWGAPMFDEGRQTVYVGTGQNYSHPTTDTSDAIIAMNAETGQIRWTMQATENDAYNLACSIPGHPNCPAPTGPDLDFGAPPMLVSTRDGRGLVIAGQKSGGVFALDPDSGEVVWHTRIGSGGALGGIHWGLAANETAGLVFVPVSDIRTYSAQGAAAPGLFALDIATGETRWQHERESRCAERRCYGGLSAAITATDSLVVVGSLDGFIEVIDSATGKRLWQFDTWQDFDTVNSIRAKGGAIDAHGPHIAGNQLIVSSGYNSFGEAAGNVLLVFELKGAVP
jgi:polyvinyl alcohol dehydrogenase (cytochrome)